MNPIQQSYTPATSGSTQRVELPQAPAGRGGAAAPAPAPAGGDTVSISQSARDLLQGVQAAAGNRAAAAAASPQRLQALRQAIANGSYQVDAQRVAQGLLADSRALASASAGARGGSAS